ncbi:MAG: metallophosphoesterase, partial [Bacilli bacterium]|nr:metallophosphoesterase [Bacilli bacterium]
MNTSKKLTKLLNNSLEIEIDHTSKIIMMSDCHRGTGNAGDNFTINKNIFMAALNYYYDNQYTYIEVGDGDELWENDSYNDIIIYNKDVFELMSKFYQRKQFYMLFGNHDIAKNNNGQLNGYYSEKKNQYMPLFPDIIVHEGLILKDTDTNHKILITHGHQGDLLNDTMWKVTKLLVRYLWYPLESIGVRNPTSAASNNYIKRTTEHKLIDWTKQNNQLLITGHTHQVVFPKVG